MGVSACKSLLLSYNSPTMSIRMRHTRGHSNNRRSHHALKEPRLSKDPDTGEFHLRHRANMATGRYKGRVVVDLARKAERKAAKEQARANEARGDSNEPPKDTKPVQPEEVSKH